jgi:hypothetical protein
MNNPETEKTKNYVYKENISASVLFTFTPKSHGSVWLLWHWY